MVHWSEESLELVKIARQNFEEENYRISAVNYKKAYDILHDVSGFARASPEWLNVIKEWEWSWTEFGNELLPYFNPRENGLSCNP